MPLKFPSSWRFDATKIIPAVPVALINELHALAVDLSDQHSDQQEIVEIFKSHFGNRSGSSNLDWAVSDLRGAMEEKKSNAANFISAYWSALEEIQVKGLETPSAEYINSLINSHGIPFAVRPPNLVKITEAQTAGNYFTKSHIATNNTATSSLNSLQAQPQHLYIRGNLIGQGAFGSVYRATRQTSGGIFEFALKLLDPSPLNEDIEKARPRFRREVEAIQKLQHRGIVPYFDAGFDTDGRPFLVMPMIHGENIRDAASAEPFWQRVSLMTEVLDAMHHAHQNDVLHRDLKPSNILVRKSDKQPIVVDFGSAYIVDNLDKTSLTTQAVGSLGYIPSEVIANPKTRTSLHDIYSCAVITYELIAGHRPDPADYEPLEKIAPELSPLDPVLRRALGAASKRHTSALELKNDLVAIISHANNRPLR
ncbi:serine/threonine protein kinase [Myxococcus sp. K38C18041901]|uniref:serine/threonine protein kinase n=1 Tax=Myxococcus guangdongensis TaxID=2906760 RepID=UPI0020A7F857|nr:serine/threonine-protein kinase [Myxococcus guangdongensis]MCP3060973.1 serine/threonine protein kinase [Myxococcus guangdongensis]